MSDGVFNGVFDGRVGVIIEVAPNQFFQYVMKEASALIELERRALDGR